VMPKSIMALFDCFCETVHNKRKKRGGFRLVWHTVVWSIWIARNNAIFNGVVTEPMNLVEEIKVLSWRWSMNCLKISHCIFYEWSWDPGNCFLR
jgi:hypothetical protein